MPGKEIKGTSKIANYRHGGRAGFKEAGSVKPGGISRLTGDTGGVKEVFPGMGITGGASRGVKVKPKSEYRLKHQLKKIQKEPDKKFKSHNPATEKVKSRHGKVHEVRKKDLVKGSLGKKTYKSDVTKYHRAHQRMGLIKD